ncbi:hypothetical protein M8C11_30135, partial [Micromonospora sp. CPM1]|uniref:hypothetical protein n=1 Tax=Micromonospora sp. CPM1 TaxID=2944809 RepID=UPI00207C8594
PGMTRRRPTRREQARQVEVFDPLALRNLQEVLRERLERAELEEWQLRMQLIESRATALQSSFPGTRA